MGKSSLSKEAKKLVKRAEEQGFRVREKKNGWMLLTPNGQGTVMIHKTQSDQAALRNDIARLRRYGFKPEAQKKGR
jgi:hypothetical protein